MADLINPKSYIESIKEGTAAPKQQQTTIISSTDKEPSAVGGLLALGATLVGATALGSRIPGIRNYFKIAKATKPNITYSINKPVQAAENLPTATGQASELVTTGRDLVKLKSKFGEVENIPFTYGAGYKGTNPLVGSAAYDRVMEAPFDVGSAKQWTKFLQEGSSGQLKVNTGPLAGVSRQVQAEELADLNLIGKGPDGNLTGFLKYADDNNIPIERDTLLQMIKDHPINKIKKVIFDVPGDPISDMKQLQTDFVALVNKIPSESKRSAAQVAYQDSIMESFNGSIANRTLYGDQPLDQSVINDIQNKVIDLARKTPEISADAQNWLRKFNQTTGAYNLRGNNFKASDMFQSSNVRFNPRAGSDTPNFYPRYKGYGDGQYNLLGGENFTESVYVYDGVIPNTTKNAFKYVEGRPHYFENRELVFARYDDLPNPKLGGRHLRVSEVQSDLHSSARAADPNTREKFFKNRINTFNQDAMVKDLRAKRTKILDQLQPYTEIGRGYLTPNQVRQKNKLMYELQQIDRSALRELATKGTIDATTYAPMGSNVNDYVVKDLLRTMAEKNINSISIVPASMNQNVKGLYSAGKTGNEANYGLMNGRALVPETRLSMEAVPPPPGAGRGVRGTPAVYAKTGKMIPSKNKYSSLNESLNRIAKQYGAKFEILPMPKSNPNKEYKVIHSIKVGKEGDEAIKLGRKHYNRVKNGEYFFDDHIAAADNEDTATRILGEVKSRMGSNRPEGVFRVVRMAPESKGNYEMVPTLVAPNDVLKKFLLPFKAYMNEGGFVEKTNIFKSIL